jgi:hypothetical protein
MALGVSHSNMHWNLKPFSSIHSNISSPQPSFHSSTKPSPNSRELNDHQDPFTNFQLSSNGKGRLRPVLTKHRRTPTLTRVQEFKDNEEVLLRKSASYKVMRTVFRVENKRGASQKSSNPKINTENNSEMTREVQTPFFKPHPKSLERPQQVGSLIQKRNGRTLFFEHVKKTIPVEVSFGVSEKKKEIRSSRVRLFCN